MIAIICLDDKNGYLFNKRRQSKDSVLRERILSLACESKLWMNAYTQKQFEEQTGSFIEVSEDFADSAQNGEYCFFENVSPTDYENKIEKVIIFKWNKVYPSDVKFNMDLSDFKLVSQEDFKGSSHDKITMEVYVK
jgi:hypothetical protein